MSRRRKGALCFALAVGTILLYWPATRGGFVYDDLTYLLGEPALRQGVGPAGIRWALSAVHAANWYPLTLLSHLLDVQLFDLRPFGPHLVNILLHATNSVLLFLLLRRMTGAVLRSALLAALFAAHPLHVESVAWISARKDVLSACFSLLALHAYVGYVRRPQVRAYLVLVLLLACALASKPMAVTLPLLLLLLDFWPLGRLAWRGAPDGGATLPRATRLVGEKLPLFLLAATSAVATFLAQRRGGAVASTVDFPVPLRLANALDACGRYLTKTLWPSGLEAFYPYPLDGVPSPRLLLAGAALLALTVIALRAARRHPALPFGWLWFGGALLPTLGLVQVGSQALADRYTYVPHIGLFVAAVWGGAALSPPWPRRGRSLAAVAAILLLAALASLTRNQLAVWRSNEGLFAHAARVDPDNWVALTELGLIAFEQGRVEEGIARYAAALRANRGYAPTHFNLGVALGAQGRMTEAEASYRRALALSPDLAEAHYNLGLILLRQGRTTEALRHLEAAVRAKPEFPEPHAALGTTYLQLGDGAAAVEHLRRALALRPDSPIFRANLERALRAR